MTHTELRRIDAQALRVAAAGVRALPIEQSAVWEAFESSQGRECWGRYAWSEDDRVCAVVALYAYSLHGVPYLWARSGPVWLREQSPERARRFREDLVAEVRRRSPRVAFVRMHAHFRARDVHDVLQGITYDRTVVVDTSGGTEESVLAGMTTEGRRAVRRARARMEAGGGEVVEETGLSGPAFHEYYEVLEETAARDGFRPHSEGVYADLLGTLGADHARLFGVRVRGRLVCWDIVLVNDRRAVASYGASSAASREVLGPDALDFAVAVILAGEGIVSLDLMGTHSPRVPELYSVGRYKARFAASTTDVDGAWDVPVRPLTYLALRRALHAKRWVRAVRTRAGRP